jgi:hypothetical protein
MQLLKRTVSQLADSIEQLLKMEILNGIVPTLSDIQRSGDSIQSFYSDVTPEEINAAVNIVQSRVNVVIRPANSVSRDYEPWVNTSQAVANPYYWDRYAKHLSDTGKANIVRSLDRETRTILDLTADPTLAKSWDRRGLVLGNVQSGKTANYTGLICKASDAGFRVIIVIAGIHNNLRNQTQERIDEGFIGSEKVLGNRAQTHKQVGVGLIDNERRPTHFTSKAHDFTKKLAESVGMSLTGMTEPGVFVIKKNAGTLRSLIQFLKDNGTRSGGKINESLLLIDDEADNASINVGRDQKISTINGLIREILNLFERSAYVGYTATPFANIFIDPTTPDEMLSEDLFPRSFIVSLDAPSDYFGASRVFLENPEIYLRKIDDHDTLLPLKHKIDIQLDDLPQTLLEALRTHILTRALRVLRLQGSEHSAMLINVSRFNDVQSQVHELLDIELTDLKNSIRISTGFGAAALKDSKINLLHSTFESEFSDVEFSWKAVQEALWEAIAPIETITINSKSTGSLSYDSYRDKGRHIIAIGGYSLSRGLTLEGLSTTYFLRNSVMYDTLLQMGRWFGYRPGYQDLCRVWLTPEAIDWYSHIAIAVEELRDDLRRMQQEGGTPEDFGLKVRSHPDNLIITARNKLGTGENFPVSIGLAGKLLETATIHYGDSTAEEMNEQNLELIRKFLETISDAKVKVFDNTERDYSYWPYGYIYKSVPRDLVLKFLDNFQIHDNLKYRFKELNRRYILDRGADLELWDVYIPTLETPNELVHCESKVGLTMNMRTRSAFLTGGTPGTGIQITSKARVGVALDESAGLTEDQVKAARAIDPNKSISGRSFRVPNRNPLLVIHILAIAHPIGESEKGKIDEYLGPYAAYGLSFPQTSSGQKDTIITYMVNETYRQGFFDGFEDDDLRYGDELEDGAL